MALPKLQVTPQATLQLKKLDREKIKSSYGDACLPRRMAFLYPDAADAFMALNAERFKGAPIVISDMYRSLEASMERHAQTRMALPPGYSPHGLAFSWDAKIDGMTDRDKLEYDTWLATYGFYCHRWDHKIGKEAWHFNYLPGLYSYAEKVSSAAAIERVIVAMYGAAWRAFKISRLLNATVEAKFGPFKDAEHRQRVAWLYTEQQRLAVSLR